MCVIYHLNSFKQFIVQVSSKLMCIVTHTHRQYAKQKHSVAQKLTNNVVLLFIKKSA